MGGIAEKRMPAGFPPALLRSPAPERWLRAPVIRRT
jgi:hypothetical protein